MNLPIIRCVAFVGLILGGCRSADVTVPAALATYARPGSFAVRVRDVEWSDRVRNVVIRARIYEPDDNRVHPIVVFSHGLGNSRLGYSYLGRHWASWGITSVHVEHPGAGQDIASRGWIALYRAGFDSRLETSAVADVRFVLDQLRADRVGVAGHSLGAYVALALSGAIKSIPADPRVQAAVALSMSENLPRTAYGETSVPTLHFTGTSDSSLFYGTTRRMRRIPFEQTTGDVAYLVTLRGANHSTFSADDRTATAGRIDAIKSLTTLWWKAWLEQNGDAQRLLASIDGRSLGSLEKR
jgi:pimeloyl-ACP methyl ester carboxylesterase